MTTTNDVATNGVAHPYAAPITTAATIHTHANPSVLIIGAGIGGISLALELDRRGLTNWTITDREAGVGGTWWQNRYPGCRCDIPAVAYSHSRFTNSQWTETHPERAEIQKYWENIVKTQGLENRIRLHHDYIKAEWDAERSLYVVTLHNTEEDRDVVVEAQVLVSATGLFSEPNRIAIPGEDEFKGTVIHAARWPFDLKNEDLHGKSVVVVGNGCSGVQIVGTLGLDPKINLVSVARSQQWFRPSVTGGPKAARNSAPNSEELKAFRARWPSLQRLYRQAMLVIMDRGFYYQWEKQGAKARKQIEKDLAEWMKSRVPEDMKDRIVPDFSFMAKRYIFEDGYFAALNKPHVRGVYGRLAGLTPDGVKLDDGTEIEADYVVLSTGYDAGHIDTVVHGSTDSTSNYKTKADLTFYHGVALPGMPNFYTMLGNNWVVNHTSVTAVLEIQASYLGQVIQAMRDNAIPVLEVKRAAAEEYDNWIIKQLKKTTWMQVHNYWRKEGSGRVFTHYPGMLARMYWQNVWPVWADYKGAERLAVRQRIRRIVFTVGLVVATVLGGRHVWHAGVPQRAVLATLGAVLGARTALEGGAQRIVGLLAAGRQALLG